MKIKYNTIIVDDIHESTRFYEETIGLKKIEEYEMPDKFHMTMLTDGENILELIQNGEKACISNIGLEVDNINSTIRNFEEKEIQMDKNEQFKLITLKDPNGIEIVISQKSND